MGKAVSVKLIGDQELKKVLDMLGKSGRPALLPAARAGADVIEVLANTRAPGPHIITGNEKQEGGTAEVEIGPDEEHWHYRFLEFGAGPHEITGDPLVFKGKGGIIRTNKVNHPGIPAAPFLRNTADEKKNAAADAAGEVFRAKIEEIRRRYGLNND
jgi:HK97 gp10 family phage protein